MELLQLKFLTVRFRSQLLCFFKALCIGEEILGQGLSDDAIDHIRMDLIQVWQLQFNDPALLLAIRNTGVVDCLNIGIECLKGQQLLYVQRFFKV
jgi:hypothetical protein